MHSAFEMPVMEAERGDKVPVILTGFGANETMRGNFDDEDQATTDLHRECLRFVEGQSPPGRIGRNV